LRKKRNKSLTLTVRATLTRSARQGPENRLANDSIRRFAIVNQADQLMADRIHLFSRCMITETTPFTGTNTVFTTTFKFVF